MSVCHPSTISWWPSTTNAGVQWQWKSLSLSTAQFGGELFLLKNLMPHGNLTVMKQAASYLCCLLLVQLRARLVHIAHNVCHAGLVAHEGCQLRGLGRVILREGLDLSLSTPAPLLRQEAQRPVPRICKSIDFMNKLWVLTPHRRRAYGATRDFAACSLHFCRCASPSKALYRCV